MSSQQFQQARQLIEAKRFLEARAILEQINDVKAKKWLRRINSMEQNTQEQTLSNLLTQQTSDNYEDDKYWQSSSSAQLQNLPEYGKLQMDEKGIIYDIKPVKIFWLFVRQKQQFGYIPMDDVSTVEFIKERVLGTWGFLFVHLLLMAVGGISYVLGVFSFLYYNYGWYYGLTEYLIFIGIGAFVLAIIIRTFWTRSVLNIYGSGAKIISLEMSNLQARSYISRFQDIKNIL